MEPFTPLSPRARLLFYLQASSRLVFFWIPLSIGVAVAVGTASTLLWGAVAGSALLFVRFVVAVWWPALSWQRWGYQVAGDELVITRGVWLRSITASPIGRVQHVDVRQGLFEQWLGLARLHVHTASGVGADGVIPGLERPVADALRDRLVRPERHGDDGV
jgi:membrane protein YdbS with pleckstrin-like domain